MSNGNKHANGSEYPIQFFESDTINRPHCRHLLPYVLRTNEVVQRKEICARLFKYHREVTGRPSQQTIEQLGSVLKRLLKTESLFEDANSIGYWKYLGPSVADDGEDLIEPITVPTEPPPQVVSYQPDKLVSAKESGNESLYVWWHRDSELLAQSQNDQQWAMKIGKHNSSNVASRFEQYTVAIPYKIRLGLIVSCQNATKLEKAVHLTLQNRGKKIDEEGNEWFVTSVDEVLEVLQAHHLIDSQIRP